MEWVGWVGCALGAVIAGLVGAVWVLRVPAAVHIPVKGRHVLITGGSSGIGLALAHLVVKEGAAKVSLLARTEAKLEEARQAIEKATGHRVHIFSADVKDYGSTAKALAAAGSVDVLICSHGVSNPSLFEETSLEVINHQVDTVLKGNIHVIKAAIPGMKQGKKGRDRQHPTSICIISSQAGQIGVYGFAPYAAAKFGLRGLAEVLQQELFPHNIRVSLAFPPDTLTPGFEEESKTKPEVTALISQSSSCMQPEVVARRILGGLKAGRFIISCNLDGFALSLATAGLSPHTTFSQGCLEVFLGGIMRLVAMTFLRDWYNIIDKWHRKQQPA